PNNLSVLDSVQSTIFTYTDLNPPTGPVYYAIEVVGNSQCSPSVPSPHHGGNNLKSLNGTHSRSNVKTVITGITEINGVNDILIFPNPASNTLTIRKQSGFMNFEIRIMDVFGKMVHSQGLTNASKTTIDISQLSGGIYFYEVRSGLQTSASVRGKFVKE
ncbi:MAG: T9SS type A sorting domain-containing protein, partial [Bacteroidota bacterium]